MNHNHHLPVIAPRYYDKELEIMIDQKDKLLKEQAAADARHLAELNLPAAGKGACLPFIAKFKAGYEETIAAVHHHLETGSHLLKGKTEFDYAKKNEKELQDNIRQKKELNHNDTRDLKGYNPRVIALRKLKYYILGIFLLLVETVLNTRAFQIFGDSLLFAACMSAGVSLIVFYIAHYGALTYKECTTRFQRILTVTVALAIVTAIFVATTKMRAEYFTHEGIATSNSSLFIIYNLGIFLISGIAALYWYPSWTEIKEDREKAKIYLNIQKRQAEINILEKELKKVETEKIMRGNYRLGMPIYTKNLIKRIDRKYHECVEKFRNTNILYRTDRQVPACFSDPVPELDIENLDELETIIPDNDE